MYAFGNHFLFHANISAIVKKRILWYQVEFSEALEYAGKHKEQTYGKRLPGHSRFLAPESVSVFHL